VLPSSDDVLGTRGARWQPSACRVLASGPAALRGRHPRLRIAIRAFGVEHAHAIAQYAPTCRPGLRSVRTRHRRDQAVIRAAGACQPPDRDATRYRPRCMGVGRRIWTAPQLAAAARVPVPLGDERATRCPSQA